MASCFPKTTSAIKCNGPCCCQKQQQQQKHQQQQERKVAFHYGTVRVRGTVQYYVFTLGMRDAFPGCSCEMVAWVGAADVIGTPELVCAAVDIGFRAFADVLRECHRRRQRANKKAGEEAPWPAAWTDGHPIWLDGMPAPRQLRRVWLSVPGTVDKVFVWQLVLPLGWDPAFPKWWVDKQLIFGEPCEPEPVSAHKVSAHKDPLQNSTSSLPDAPAPPPTTILHFLASSFSPSTSLTAPNAKK